MLNPELKVNPKIFEERERKSIRDDYGDALLGLGEKIMTF